jgi:hypothetical protein
LLFRRLAIMNRIELCFPVLGSQLPSDHGYALYGALVKTLPRLHDEDCSVRIGSIQGTYVGKGMLQLESAKAWLRLRLPAEDIPAFLPLAGKSLNVGGHRIRLGAPQVRALIPAPNLVARLVIIKASSPKTDPAVKKSRTPFLTKRYLDPAEFLAGARKQLEALEIRGEPGIPLNTTGPRAGQPRRHVLRVHDKQVVGFSLQVTGLTAEESVRLQEEGVGGRGKMGCGFFVPMREEKK